ncbi:MAG: hypothetical protein ACI97K_003209 [Glaciecola sp.]|jgi:hypothetical protein
MVSVKTPLLIVASIILAAIGFVVSGFIFDETSTIIQRSMLSIGVILNATFVFVLSSMTNSAGSDYDDEDEDEETTAITDDGDVSTLYVGNLPYRANEQIVKEHFENFGYVRSVRLMKDKRTGKRKGFGFVEVAAQEADAMIKKLNDSEFQERTIKVRPAKDKVA